MFEIRALLFSMADVRVTHRAAWVYREFFHGDCDILASDSVINRYGERPYQPLRLVRNVRLMPAVFFGGISLVVNEEVVRGLGSFDSVDLNPCKWDAVYDLPVDEKSVRELCEQFSVLTDDFYEWLKGRLRRPGAEQRRVSFGVKGLG